MFTEIAILMFPIIGISLMASMILNSEPMLKENIDDENEWCVIEHVYD
jgi:hypothetical protein